MSRMSSKTIATSIAAFGTLLIGAAAAHALPMSGSSAGHVDTQTPQMIPPDRMNIRQTASGTNAGPGTPFDGAKVTWSEVVKLKSGQGTHQGVITMMTPTGTTVSPYRGTVSTDAQGRVTAKGTFRTTKGTGDFTGLKGNGTYSAAYSSKTDFNIQWQGNFQPASQKTSKR